MKFPKRGLYAITQCENRTPETIVADVAAAIRGGAAVVQYRDKHPVDALALATELVRLCHRHGVPLIINDNIELVAAAGAAGVHLGKHDGIIAEARNRLGPDTIIGVSCYDDVGRAVDAEAQGADYVAFGRFFPSSSKPLASPARIETLHKARQALSLPIVAIGGILPENGAQLLTAGANLLAAIDGVFGGDPEGSARAYQALFGTSLNR